MCDSVTTGKENASKDWNYIISMFLTTGRRITAGGAEKSKQCHKYFLQNSRPTFVFERPQVGT